ncbi:MAG: hypothetical protein ABIN55_13675 [Aeromicrobium sp.]
MTTPTRVLGLLFATATYVAVGATSALADAPDSAAWPEGEGRSVLDTLILFVGGTVGLFVLISLFALITARRNFTPTPGTDLEPASSSAATHH